MQSANSPIPDLRILAGILRDSDKTLAEKGQAYSLLEVSGADAVPFLLDEWFNPLGHSTVESIRIYEDYCASLIMHIGAEAIPSIKNCIQTFAKDEIPSLLIGYLTYLQDPQGLELALDFLKKKIYPTRRKGFRAWLYGENVFNQADGTFPILGALCGFSQEILENSDAYVLLKEAGEYFRDRSTLLLSGVIHFFNLKGRKADISFLEGFLNHRDPYILSKTGEAVEAIRHRETVL